MEKAKETKNPLLENYGTVVERFFTAERDQKAPLVLFPGVESASQVDTLPYKPDLAFFTPAAQEMEDIQHSVAALRARLAQEGQASLRLGDQKKKFDNIADKVRAARGQAEGIQQVSFHLETFRDALRSGDESLLPGNPFYTLTKLVFRHNVDGALRLFENLVGDLSANAPENMGPSRSLRAIWGPANREEPITHKLTASLGCLVRWGNLLVILLLWALSAFTSYRALLTLLQGSSMAAWLGAYFTPQQSELLHVTLATLGGLLLSIAVLDYRARLLRGIAETGKIFSGLWATFLVQPRWTLLAFCLALFSGVANYDSIALLFSSKADLSGQWLNIRQQVHTALGSPVSPGDPPALHDSLYDLNAQLQGAVNRVGELFARIPEEELVGKSPVADTRKGPRYWAKYFIVNGGFVPGSTDVARAFRDVQFARNMDQLLRGSGIPLDKPIAQKLQSLSDLYAKDLDKTASLVQRNLAQIEHLLAVGELSLSTIHTIYSFDNRQVNLLIQELLSALINNRLKFDQIIQTLDTLSESHLQLLVQVDKSLEKYLSDVRISTHVAPPADIPLGALTFGPIQPGGQKSLAELSHTLNSQYGVQRGTGLLVAILFCAFAIDWLPWLLLCRRTARQGMLDRQMADELLNYMKEWEDAFVELAKSFFYRPAIQQALRGLTFPNETGVRNAFFKVLEEIDPRVQDSRDYTPMDQRRAWLLALFALPHNRYATGYNARASAIGFFLAHKESCYPQLIKKLFPGLPCGKKSWQQIEKGTFLEFYRSTESGQTQDKEQFAAELRWIATGGTREEEAQPATDAPGERAAWWRGVRQRLAAQMARLPLPRPAQHPQPATEAWAEMLQKAVSSAPATAVVAAHSGGTDRPATRSPSSQHINTLHYWLLERTFRDPFPAFPHTRRNWLLVISSATEESLEELDTLHDFIPDFVKMLKKVMTNTLPIIQESLDPLEEICNRFPEQYAAQGIVSAAELKERFRAIEKESLSMWGACVSHLLGDGTPSATPFQASGNPELAGMLATGGDISQFYDRIHTLMSDAKEAAQRAKAIEEATLATVKHSVSEIKELCDSIQQMLTKINMLSLDLRRQRPLPHAKLRALNEGNSILDRAPRDVRYILEARDKVLASQNLFSDENFNELSQLRSMAHALHNRVDNLLRLVDK
ncbi:MAG: hypothetical protein HQL88_07030 [Magnetococcales bacterium]|nr:hypothetical protein [Magnetococcales bacterium]